MKTIQKTKQINAPKEKVWNVLLEDAHNRIWMTEFMEGAHAQTDWIQGHKVRFLDNDNNGIVGTIKSKQPYDKIEMVYEGEVRNGVDDFESEMGQAMNGSRENYYLSENNGVTTLKVEVDMGEDWYDTMSEAWDRALVKIDDLSLSV
ncbi:SRPBCC family protein [Flavobacterium caeni]|uniref:Activator of Hsp90 ATPase homolog 1-like protein n=1 Tax=Flavobacterium caeni TaxID=490189 RepID=A0A1G5F7P3_9FLAO|nr:SRPBCC domain-containing protein [Flavobacterium caeni]SCY34648.1 Activator of Hsp90 ATPase homolog 1-like protein [Flavobacterium caeni]